MQINDSDGRQNGLKCNMPSTNLKQTKFMLRYTTHKSAKLLYNTVV